jgi:hypothetical protein
MSRDSSSNEFIEILKGFFLLMGCHILSGIFIFALGFVVGSFVGNYSFAVVWLVGSMGFLFWQLLYVIPIVFRLRRRGAIGMMKGVIVGAVLTALVNGVCFLTFAR